MILTNGKKIRQNEGSFALFSLNVNKVSQIFSLPIDIRVLHLRKHLLVPLDSLGPTRQ